jgi:hypothetical protein
VAFTGALAALALGVDVRVGLFAASVAVGVGIGAAGRRTATRPIEEASTIQGYLVANPVQGGVSRGWLRTTSDIDTCKVGRRISKTCIFGSSTPETSWSRSQTG